MPDDINTPHGASETELSIARWRRSLSGLSRAQRDELEDHLRTNLSAFDGLPLSPQEKAIVAVMRLGRSGRLVREFQRGFRPGLRDYGLSAVRCLFAMPVLYVVIAESWSRQDLDLLNPWNGDPWFGGFWIVLLPATLLAVVALAYELTWVTRKTRDAYAMRSLAA
ncbi:MAG: hypothetical protein AAGE65_02980 [Planctomycetota bacterium]